MTDTSDPVLGFTTSWINRLAARADFVDVVTMECGELAVAENVRVFSVGKERGYSEPRRLVRFYMILFRLLNERAYNAAFAHMMPLFTIMAYPLLRLRNIPITLWYHHKSTPAILRVAEKLATHVISASREGFRLPSNKLVVTGHGIDTSLFIPPNNYPPRFVIATVGRLSPIKNIHVLLDAAAELRSRVGFPSFELRIVGGAYENDLAYERSLRQRCERLALQNIVSFVGPVRWRETVDEYRKASVMVNLSDTGSLDKAGLEAMSCGVPLVTWNVAFQPLLKNVSTPLFLHERTPMAVASACEAIASLSVEVRRQLSYQLRSTVVNNHGLESLIDDLAERILASATEGE